MLPHFAESGTHIVGIWSACAFNALSAMYQGPGRARFLQGALHTLKSLPVNKRPDEYTRLARIANSHRSIDLRKPRNKTVVDIVVHKQPP